MELVNNKTFDSKKIAIDTKPFGKMEISSEEVIFFPDGIFAFENLKKYVLLSTKKDLSFRWLQSLEEKNISFLIVDPVEFIPDYVPKIPKGNYELIETTGEDETGLFCIVTIPNHYPEKMTINLQGPIIINFHGMLAAQFVSENISHEVRQPLFELLNNREKVV